ncbi:hypothetical protein PENANT_c011G00094 [Penicillium antarcticum]|uniref:ATP-dependent RNA helicase n=1 Tax=Penicillium antarcticum TaxID=416450 RepID=A0A1V6Q6K1_9EURO|nr:uncharacterized protein N7508_002943 [Penicillium antarcticum]KAJ5312113.1 hypothetical protein N7508_002943 [Penicillium antarcticum]OQD84853.1 hypothetical protein PENANT_c011G00094 [Penicillium antarcticum]
MLGTLRRFGVSNALRASAPRINSTRWASQLPKMHAPLASSVLTRSLHSSFPKFSAVAQESVETESPKQIQDFAELGEQNLVDSTIIKNITHPSRMNLKTMTEVQSMTLQEIVKGTDVLAQAKTGTGKTLAFLLPTLQNILNDPGVDVSKVGRYSRTAPSEIRALIISPTRELAEQIAVEAKKVAFGTGLIVQTAVGGTQKRAGLMKIQREGCHLLIGTPGRLKDIFSDPWTGVAAPKLNTLILDEADRLLDQGFAPDIKEIQGYLPDPTKIDRQTLMFSATVPREVMSLVRQTLKPGFQFVQTVREDEVPTHHRVPQKCVWMRGLENGMPALLEIAKNYESRRTNGEDLRPFKAIAYYNSTAETKAAADAFNNLRRSHNFGKSPMGELKMLEINSRLTQAERTRSAESFRRSPTGILFSSDVTARGMDFPDVTHVIQIGVPRDTETYIHRLGRTARAGKEGEGWLLIHDGEEGVYRSRLGRIPMQQDSLPAAKADMSQATATFETNDTVSQMKAAMAAVGMSQKIKSFMGQLGTLTGNFDSKRYAIQALNQQFVDGFGMASPPEINARLAQQMGLSRVPGVNIGSGSSRPVLDEDDMFTRGGALSSSGHRSPSRYGGRGGFSSRGGDRGGFSRDGDRGGFSRSDRGGFSRDRRGGSSYGDRRGDRGSSRPPRRNMAEFDF